MYDIVEQIRDDHISMARILSIMEQEINPIDGADDCDYALLIDCMRYMVEYADVVHHPKEDAMMQCISKKSAYLEALVGEIEKQHKLIRKSSTEFYDIVKAVESEEIVSKEKISELGLKYIQMQRAHMKLENEHLLSKVRALLLHDDYLNINKRYEKYRDPQLSENFETEYSALYHSLVSTL